METVLQVPQICVNSVVFVRDIVAVCILYDGQVRSISDPKVFSMPAKALNIIQACCKLMLFIKTPVSVSIL